MQFKGPPVYPIQSHVLKKLNRINLFSTPRYIRKHFPLWKDFKIFDDFQPKILNILADFNVRHGLHKVRMGNLVMGLG